MKIRACSSWLLRYALCLALALASVSAGSQEAASLKDSLPQSGPSWESFGELLTMLEAEAQNLRAESMLLSSELQTSRTALAELTLSLARSELSLKASERFTEEARAEAAKRAEGERFWKRTALSFGVTSLLLALSTGALIVW